MVYKSKIALSVPADEIVTELTRIADMHGGTLNPQDVVDESRAENAPLHSLFEWDDAAAAEKYRVVQARFIIRNVTVEEEDGQPVRQFVHTGEAGSGYMRIQTVLQSVDMTRSLLEQARSDMNSFIAKYRALKEVAGVVSEMEKAVNGQLRLKD